MGYLLGNKSGRLIYIYISVLCLTSCSDVEPSATGEGGTEMDQRINPDRDVLAGVSYRCPDGGVVFVERRDARIALGRLTPDAKPVQLASSDGGHQYTAAGGWSFTPGDGMAQIAAPGREAATCEDRGTTLLPELPSERQEERGR